MRDFINPYFDLFRQPVTGAVHALFLRVPGTPIELYVERRETPVAWFVERRKNVVQIWCGRFDVTLCTGKPSAVAAAQ